MNLHFAVVLGVSLALCFLFLWWIIRLMRAAARVPSAPGGFPEFDTDRLARHPQDLASIDAGLERRIARAYREYRDSALGSERRAVNFRLWLDLTDIAARVRARRGLPQPRPLGSGREAGRGGEVPSGIRCGGAL